MEMNEQIKVLHRHLLIIMEEIHKICVENNIRYSLAGGSLIGAVRHRGFIPWDDDMDIMMSYDDFERFKGLISKLEHPWLEFNMVGITPGCYRTIMKAYDTRTTLIQTINPIPKGVFVDIFPYVCVGNTKWGSMFEYYLHHIFTAPLVRKVNVYKDKNYLKEVLLTTIGRLIPVSFLTYCIDAQYERLRKKKTLYSSDLDGTVKGIIRTEFFQGVELIDFEDTRFYCLKKAHEYLTSDYGDYMKLPPENQRNSHHILYLDVNVPYKQYKKEHGLG